MSNNVRAFAIVADQAVCIHMSNRRVTEFRHSSEVRLTHTEAVRLLKELQQALDQL